MILQKLLHSFLLCELAFEHLLLNNLKTDYVRFIKADKLLDSLMLILS